MDERITFGPGPGLTLQTTDKTPYLALRDINSAPILALAVTDKGFTVHLADTTHLGPPLAVEYDHNDRNL